MDGNGILKYGDGYVCDDGAYDVMSDDDGFSDNTAHFICRELGYAFFQSYISGMNIKSGFISMDDLDCPGNATSLSSCEYTFHHNCGLSEGIKLHCQVSRPGNSCSEKCL